MSADGRSVSRSESCASPLCCTPGRSCLEALSALSWIFVREESSRRCVAIASTATLRPGHRPYCRRSPGFTPKSEQIGQKRHPAVMKLFDDALDGLAPRTRACLNSADGMALAVILSLKSCVVRTPERAGCAGKQYLGLRKRIDPNQPPVAPRLASGLAPRRGLWRFRVGIHRSRASPPTVWRASDVHEYVPILEFGPCPRTTASETSRPLPRPVSKLCSIDAPYPRGSGHTRAPPRLSK